MRFSKCTKVEFGKFQNLKEFGKKVIFASLVSLKCSLKLRLILYQKMGLYYFFSLPRQDPVLFSGFQMLRSFIR